MQPEFELIKQLKEGNISAFNQLFKAYSNRLYAFGLKYMKSVPDAEGLVQDVFMKIWRNRERLDADKSFKAYIFTIAYNEIKTYFQHKSVYLDDTASATNEQSDESLEQSIAYQSVLDRISVLLKQLPAKKQEIFNLSRFEGKSAKEIAKQLNISSKTVDNQVSEVIAYLRTKVKDSDMVIGLFFFMFLNG